MPNWDRFRAAVLESTSQQRLLSACERVWEWLDLADDARAAAVDAATTSEADARWIALALPFVRLRLLRAAGRAGDEDCAAWLLALDERVRRGHADAEEARLARRYAATFAIARHVAARYPEAAKPVPPPDPRLEQIAATVPQLSAAMYACGAGSVTPERLAALRQAMTAFEAIAVEWPQPRPTDHAWWLGQAEVTAGRGALELGDLDAARAAFERAVDHFSSAGEALLAREARERLVALEQGRAADFDSAARRELQVLLERHGVPQRAAALANLAREMHHAGDVFEAARLAEELARLLVAAGYADPEAVAAADPDAAIDAALDGWIERSSRDAAGETFFAHLLELIGQYAVVLGMRVSRRLNADPAGAARAEAMLRALSRLPARLFERSQAANADVERALAEWYPLPVPPTVDTNAAAGQAQQDLRWQAAFDDALYQLRLECNAAASEALLERIQALLEMAQARGSRVAVVRAQLERAYVLLALGRAAQVLPQARAARETLLGDRPAALDAFASAAERELYLTTVLYEARALATLKDRRALLDLCAPVVADIEAQRARVSSPYAQGAFLATRAELYEMCAAAAYKLGEADRLLATTELLKARATLALRGAPGLADTDPEVAALAARCRAADAALAAADPAAAATRALREERRWLHDARAIAAARSRAATDPQALAAPSVAALQATLDAGEAVLSWFWLGREVLIAQLFSRERAQALHVELGTEGRALLDRYLGCVVALASEQDPLDPLIDELERLLPPLAAYLLPPPVQDFLAGCTRLAVSAHRDLHLVPMHALPWRGGRLIEAMAVRYVPNVTSLLRPWHGVRDGPVLAVGVDEFDDPALAPLPNTRAEATEVAAVHGERGRTLLGPTRAEFLAQPLAACRCVHLATHGSSVLAGDALDDPLACGIALRDGMLDGLALASLDLPAELVVLAACYSGQRALGGRGLAQLPGDDLFGLQGVLFAAGVNALLGALWPVDDESARAILVDFHRAYAAGAAPDLALQRALMTHLRSPHRRQTLYDWAPYFVSVLGRA